MKKTNTILKIIAVLFGVVFICILTFRYMQLSHKEKGIKEFNQLTQQAIMRAINDKFVEYLIDDTSLPEPTTDVLYCYIKSLDCGSCIENTLTDFIEIGDSIKKRHLGIISNFSDSLQMKIYAKKYSIENVFKANSKIISLFSIIKNDIIFFYLDSDHFIRDSFIPFFDPKLNSNYYQYIIAKRKLAFII
ncbi:MAG: hypothetical protein WC865_10825 [Bacteroidales bacterium]